MEEENKTTPQREPTLVHAGPSKYQFEIPNEERFPKSAWTSDTVERFIDQDWNIGANDKNFCKMEIPSDDIIINLQ
jgi:hypothetical protein